MKIRILLVFLFPLFTSAQSLDTLALHYSGLIKAETMSKDLHVLAADEYEGRETGKKGQKMAAAYIADQFKANGIPPYKEQTYYQPFSIDGLVNSPVFKQVAEISSEGKQFVSEKDYHLLQGRIQHALKTETVQFLGYGIEEAGYNDYKGIDVEGKTLMILQGEPFSKDSISLVTGTKTASEWSTFYKKKIERAYQKGATTLFIVDPDFEEHKIAIKTRSAFIKLEKGKPEMAVFYLSKSMADVILKKNGIDQLKKKIEAKKKPVHKTVKASLLINVRNLGEKINSENVLGFIEGSDLKDELIVITAHYDHLGKEGDVVYNGADDDGSGTSAILNIAKVFAVAKKEGHGPRRSILCIAFAGEEKGLLGSGYYVDHPEYPLKNTVCDLNIDMIGRIDDKHKGNPNYIYLIGSDKLSSELHQINETMNKTYCKLELDYTYNDEKDKNRYYYRSDHYNFAKNGIPVIFYFNGVHADYHKETDEVEKIDFNKMEKISRLVFFTAWEIANKKERIVVDSNKR
jgi:hypothetical protein